MSFSSEFKSLIAEAEFRWQQLDSVLLNRNGSSQLRGNTSELRFKHANLRAQIEEFLVSLQQIQRSYSQHQQRLSELQYELKLDLDNVRCSAVDYFAKGQYQECTGLLSFLGKIECPENLERLLDVGCRRYLELEDAGSDSLETNPLPGFKVLIEKSDAQATVSPIEVVAQNSPSRDSGPSAHQAKASEALCGVEESTTESCLATTERVADEDTGLKARLNEWPCLDIEPKRTSTAVEGAMARWVPPIRDISADGHFRGWPRRILPMAAAAVMLWLLAEVLPQLSEQPQEIPPETRAMSDPTSTLSRVIVEELRLQALDLYEAGKLQDADQICTRILAKQEDDIFALALKDTIRKSLFEKNPEIARTASEAIQEPRLSDSTPGALSISPPSQRDFATVVPLASQLTKPVSGFRDTSLPKQIPQIVGTHLAAASQPGSAKAQPARQREESAKPVAVREVNEALREPNSRIQADKPEQARVVLTKLENGYAGKSEVKTKVEEGKQQSLAMSWLQKAESAQIVGHYVTPDNENVLAYCNQTLKLDVQNRRALEMKKDAVVKAVAQAKDWIQRGRFDSARAYFASMDSLALNDSEFPYPKAELKQELQKLEFKSYPMVHEHRLGSCSGKLRINAYVISYVPSDDSGDGFTERLRSVVVAEDRDRLRISYDGMTLRLRSARHRGGQDDDAARQFYRHLIRLRVDDKATLTVSHTKPPL
jgi:hypothetical protein